MLVQSGPHTRKSTYNVDIHANPRETKSGRGKGLGGLAPPPIFFSEGRKMVHSVAFWI